MHWLIAVVICLYPSVSLGSIIFQDVEVEGHCIGSQVFLEPLGGERYGLFMERGGFKETIDSDRLDSRSLCSVNFTIGGQGVAVTQIEVHPVGVHYQSKGDQMVANLGVQLGDDYSSEKASTVYSKVYQFAATAAQGVDEWNCHFASRAGFFLDVEVVEPRGSGYHVEITPPVTDDGQAYHLATIQTAACAPPVK